MTDPRDAAAPGWGAEGGTRKPGGLAPIVAAETAAHPAVITGQDITDAVGGRLAVLVLTKSAGGDVVRRSVLSIRSAERMVERAQTRGHDARVVLVQLVPVTGGLQ